MDKEWIYGMQFQAASAVLNEHGLLKNEKEIYDLRKDCCVPGTWHVVRSPDFALGLIAENGLQKEYEAMYAKMCDIFNPQALKESYKRVGQALRKQVLKRKRQQRHNNN